MTKNTELIVLHTTRFGESSVVVHTLSKEYGRRSFLVRGAGKRATMTLMLPLTVLEADVVETGKSSLYTAKNLSAKYPLLGIRGNIYKNTMTLFLSEVLYRTLKDGSNEPGLFEWCERSILLLDAVQSDFSNFHLRFLLELAVALGFSPEIRDLQPFVGEHYALAERFMTGDFVDTMLIPMTGPMRNEMAEGIIRYLEFHTESSINIASLRVLRELFS